MTGINRAGRHRAGRHRAAVIRIRHRGANELSPGLFARFADRIRTAIARAGSVFRTHQAGATGPVMLMSAGTIAFLVLSAVSVRILREQRMPAGPSASGPIPVASATTERDPGSSRHRADVPVGAEDRVLTTAKTGPPLPPATLPDRSLSLSGNGSGTPNQGTSTVISAGTVGPGTGGGATAGAGSAPRTPAAPSGQPAVTVSVAPSGAAPAPSAPDAAPSTGPTSPS